tara:strand:- start:3592 stop:3888 length:297 start_codon:yes stop_codon:yes gene_type:complete
MEKVILESSQKRKTVYKTENGIEIKLMLHEKRTDKNYSTNVTLYYVLYSENNGVWNIYTNPKLYGETKIIDVFSSKEDAVKTVNAINNSFHFLFENIK